VWVFVFLLAALAGFSGPSVTVDPGVVTLRQPASVTVVGTWTPTLQVRLVGASVALGHRTPWTSLRRVGPIWRGTLPVPEFRGVYPIELRARAGAPVIRSEGWFLRVLAPGTLARPSFATPEEVASWWVRTMPPKATLAALKRWPAPLYDRRDPRLHQRMVIAYDSLLPWPALVPEPGRVGLFITAFRDTLDGPWRFLEAKVSP
jgi:hypothetical protein